MTCSNLAVLNKAIQGTFLSLKKVKIDSKGRFLFTWEKQWQIEQSMALFKSQKSKENGYMEITDPYSVVT